MTYNELCQDKRVQERFSLLVTNADGNQIRIVTTFGLSELWKWWMGLVEKKYGKENKITLWQRALSEFYHCTWNGYESLEHALLACILERSEK